MTKHFEIAISIIRLFVWLHSEFRIHSEWSQKNYFGKLENIYFSLQRVVYINKFLYFFIFLFIQFWTWVKYKLFFISYESLYNSHRSSIPKNFLIQKLWLFDFLHLFINIKGNVKSTCSRCFTNICTKMSAKSFNAMVENDTPLSSHPLLRS